MRDDPAPEPLWRRLDRVAGEINPFLMVLAIGLFIVQVTCLIGFLIKLPITRVCPDPAAVPTPVIGSVGTVGWPSAAPGR